MKNGNQNPSTIPPLGRAFRLKEIPGWLNKYLDVPPGRRGVAIDAAGRARTFLPGRHRLLSFWERVRGRGVGLLAGYVPAEPFATRLEAPYLLSGDGELIDASLILAAEVSDAARFFTEQVVPRGELRMASLDLSEADSQATLGALARQYAAEDLIHGLPTSRLAGEAQARLEPFLHSQGLRLSAVQFLTFWHSDDRAAVAEKVQALQERLQEVELQAKMAKVENETQLTEFIQQMAPGLVEEAGLRPVAEAVGEPPPAEGKGVRPSLGERFRTLLSTETSKEPGRQRRAWESLFHRGGKPAEAVPAVKTRRPPRYWYLGRVLWMVFVLGLGLGLTRLVNWLAQAASWGGRLEILLAIWAFVVVALLESLKVLFERREELSETTYPLPGFTYIDDLVRDDRPRADRLVREQSSQELLHVRDILNELRGRVYRAGDADSALRIKELERKFEGRAAEVQRVDFGRPVYVTDLQISRRAWDDLLDYDEDLLLFANALNDKASAIQQRYTSGELSMDLLTSLESELDAFAHRFAGRERAIQMPAASAGK